ncbi:MAG: hypothetical protein U2P59_10210 [Synergistota bacterium]|nr:hypothetical protein [Synergistota bacterium]
MAVMENGFTGTVIDTSDMLLEDFFNSCPKWIRIAIDLIVNGKVSNTYQKNIEMLVGQCKLEAENKLDDTVIGSNNKLIIDSISIDNLRLNSISNIQGINALSPKKPLKFLKDANIIIIYGLNGTGKTGYVRLLKHICGSRKRGILLPNVFKNTDEMQKATVIYSKNNKDIELNWSAGEECPELRDVGIFDSEYGKVFVENEDEVCYETPMLALFSSLISICDEVKKKLEDEYNVLSDSTIKIEIPEKLSMTPDGLWYKQINTETSFEEIELKCTISDDIKKEITELKERLNEKSPAERANSLRLQANYLIKLIDDAKNIIYQFSPEKCEKLIESKNKMLQKKRESQVIAEKDFNQSDFLKGVGSDLWKIMWEAARNFSVTCAYPDRQFPYVEDGAKCVFCQQPLSYEAKERLHAFDTFIKGEIEKFYREAQNEYLNLVNSLPNIFDDELIDSWVLGAGVPDDIRQEIFKFYSLARENKEYLLNIESNDSLQIRENNNKWVLKIEELLKNINNLAENFEKDAKLINKETLQEKLNALLSKEWLYNNSNFIKDQVEKMKKMKALKIAKSLTDTTNLSKKKGEIAKYQITAGFINRFNDELKMLNASNIKVQPIQSQVKKGHVYIKLQLKEDLCQQQHPIINILSEGERRIISIAAFLSDITGMNCLAPIIFDDPISSLDQQYENKTVRRLVELSKNRQVIIFTHRLSLAYMAEEYAKSLDLVQELICITNECWGTGEPSEISIFLKRPSNALNDLIHRQLPMARKTFEEKGRGSFRSEAELLCKSFRIILERIIEVELISEVVLRYRNSIQTKNRINQLAKISEGDCKLIEDLMTKYSYYEHSQSWETPTFSPEPDELYEDFIKLRDWLKEFKER